MLYAEKIRMKNGYENSNDFEKVQSIFIDFGKGLSEYPVDIIYDFLLKKPNSIKTIKKPNPFLKPLSKDGKKLVIAIDDLSKENLIIKLPKVVDIFN
jgi:outer membrane lipoprotein-sorting protein